MAMIALKCPHIEGAPPDLASGACAVLTSPPPRAVVVVDISQPRIDAWNSDKLPIYEPRLDEVVMAARCDPDR